MSSFGGPTTLIFRQFDTTNKNRGCPAPAPAVAVAAIREDPVAINHKRRRQLLTSLLSFSTATILGTPNAAKAENWGTHSFIKEHFFQPELSAEDSAARIRQTAEGLHSIREMLETMSWRYVLFYVRLKRAYLSKDMKNALATVPELRKGSFIKAANELVDNMNELDFYISTPKVYESYLFYEKTLTSIDQLVALLA